MKDVETNDNGDYFRMNINAEITVRVAGGSGVIKGICRNLSHTGILFETEENLSVGDVLDASVKSPTTLHEPLELNLVVKRVDKDSNGKYLVGCETNNIL